eukprot:EG_transcript_624
MEAGGEVAAACLPTLSLGGLSVSPDMAQYARQCPAAFTLSMDRSQQANPIVPAHRRPAPEASDVGEMQRTRKRRRVVQAPTWATELPPATPAAQGNGEAEQEWHSSTPPTTFEPLADDEAGEARMPPRKPNEEPAIRDASPEPKPSFNGPLRYLTTKAAQSALLAWFRQAASLSSLVLAETVPNPIRKAIHLSAGRDLKHKSFGARDSRVMTISKSYWQKVEGSLDTELPLILQRLLAESDLAGCAFLPELTPEEQAEVQQRASLYGLCATEVQSRLWVHKADARLPPSNCAPSGPKPERKPRPLSQPLQAANACAAQQKACYITGDLGPKGGRLPNVWKPVEDPLLGVMQCHLDQIHAMVFHFTTAVAGIQHCCNREVAVAPPLLERLQRCAAKVPLTPVQHQPRRHHFHRRPHTHAEYAVDAAAVAALAPQRAALPIVAQREAILAAIQHNPVAILEGPTGSGKTTQVPQYIADCPGLLSRHRPVILVTQPRRIAAINTACRVADERGQPVGQEVGYQVRFDSRVGRNTRIIFMTSGVLLRRLQDDPDLTGVGCIIIDEVHERTLDVDFCLLLVKQLLLRGQVRLKVVVMSATLQAKAFVDYFEEVTRQSPTEVPNYVTFEGRMFHVWPFFVEEALHWTGFRTDPNRGVAYREPSLPAIGCGALLHAALEGTAEARRVVKKELRKLEAASERAREQADQPDVIDMLTVHAELIAALVAAIHQAGVPGAVLVFLPGLRDIEQVQLALQGLPQRSQFLILPVHSLLPRHYQSLLFRPAPRGKRKVVLATNIAESSITIDDVTVVIDSGLMKGLEYDPARDISSLNNVQVSQANALQRRGRAGRVRPGVCIHLFPRSMFDRLSPAPTSELLRVPLEEVGLRIKALGIADVHGFLAQAVDVPETRSIDNALQQLHRIGAMDAQQELTGLGWLLAEMPLHPRLGKLLVVAAMFGVLKPVADIAAFLSVRSPFVATTSSDAAKEYRQLRAELVGSMPTCSDCIKLLRLYNAWEAAADKAAFCTQFGLHNNNLKEVKSTAALYCNSFQNDAKFGDSALFNRHSSSDLRVNAVVAMCLYPRILLRHLKWYSAYDGPSVGIERESAIVELSYKPPEGLLSYGEQTATEGQVRVGIVTEVTVLAVVMMCLQAETVSKFVTPNAREDDSVVLSCDWWMFLKLPSLATANTLLLAKSALAAQVLRFSASRNTSEVDVEFIDTVFDLIVGKAKDRDVSNPSTSPVAGIPEAVCRRLQPHEREWVGVESDESDADEAEVLVLHDSEDEPL